MGDKQPVAWSSLTPEQWSAVGKNDHASLFTRDEVRRALALLAPPGEVETILEQVYAEDEEPGTIFFYGDLLSALSLTSASAADRVRALLHETEAEAEARLAQFRRSSPA